MKKYLFLSSLLFAFTFAIAQDGINYQGAATDANGDELTNQSISIRASVLSGSASGNLEWEETHSVTTDQFGLFNVVIGQGTNTTNGATASFDDMDWGSGNHFLKIEMDATGGTNYAMIGTTQMMSVPYALYAKSAGIDSTMLAGMIANAGGGGMGGGGCDFRFPEGIYGQGIAWNLSNANDYTVPSGKNLYITNLWNSHESYNCNINGIIVTNGAYTYQGIPSGTNSNMGKEQMLNNPLILKEGDVFSTTNTHYSSFYGVLINKTIDPITWDFYSGSGNTGNLYTVPSGKMLYITNFFNHYAYSQYPLQIDGIDILQGAFNGAIASSGDKKGHYLSSPICLNAGQTINITSYASFNGYLVDENYFAGCGGGGSSSSASAVDSAMVAGMIANAGGGNMAFGDYEDINWVVTTNPGAQWSYTDAKLSNEDGFLMLSGATSYNLSIDSVLTSTPYNSPSAISLISHNHSTEFDHLIPIKKGKYFSIVSSNPPAAKWFPLESGGSSSASAGSMSVSSFGDTLTMNGQSIIVPGISFQNMTPIFSSVTDIDGNTYQTVTIGNLEFMTEDLRTHTFSNGNPIPLWTGPLNTPTYYIETNGDVMYSGMAVIDPQNVCPTGWHVATETEFNSVFSLFSDSTNTLTNCNGQPCLEYFWNSAVEVKSVDWKQIYNCSSSYNYIPNGNNQSYLNLNRNHYITSDYSTVYFNNPSLRQFNLSCSDNQIQSSYPNIDNMSLRVRCVKD